MSAHGDRGAMGERAARAYLEAKGLRFVGANLRVGRDEVDLLMREGETLVFVEVKSSECAAAHPAEHVTPWQMKRYVRAAREYVAARGLFGVNVRFDVAEVVGGDVRLIRGAFDATTA